MLAQPEMEFKKKTNQLYIQKLKRDKISFYLNDKKEGKQFFSFIQVFKYITYTFLFKNIKHYQSNWRLYI